MPTDLEIAKCQEIHKQANHIKGRVLTFTSLIETKLNCSHKYTLSKAKDDLFKHLDNTHYLFESARYNRNKLKSSFEHIIKLRNIIAHSVVSITSQDMERPLTQGVCFDKNGERIVISLDQLNDYELKAKEVLNFLDALRSLES